MATEVEVLQGLVDVVSKLQDTILEHSSIIKELLQRVNELEVNNG